MRSEHAGIDKDDYSASSRRSGLDADLSIEMLAQRTGLGALSIPCAARWEAADFVFGIDAAPFPGDRHPA
jgi:hypothetical protein